MGNDKEIIFIGTYAGNNYLKELIEKKYYDQFAANQTQDYYIHGLMNCAEKVSVYSALVMASYPNCRALLLSERKERLEKVNINNVAFLNLPGVRFISQISNLKRALSKYKHDNNKKLIVVVYAMRLPFYRAAMYIKKKYPDAVLINIVPDIPIYMHSKNESLLRQYKSRFNQWLLLHESAIFDGFVLYAKAMREILGCDESNSIVIEGIVSQPNANRVLTNKSETKIVMYAGVLDRKYGVENLAEGFLKANIPESELHFYGIGDYSETLKKLAKENGKIKYHGVVSPKDVKNKMLEATLLVNPRPTNEKFTRYSCPSKTLEYMSSGVPLLTTKLEGIPDEYFEYVYTIENETVDGMANALVEFFNYTDDERIKMGNQARDFILREKNENAQSRKLIEFADSL